MPSYKDFSHADLLSAVEELEAKLADQRRIEEKLRTELDHKDIMIQNVDVGITRIDKDLNVVFANSTIEKWFDKPMSEFVGQKCFRVFVQRDEPCPDCPGLASIESGEPCALETWGEREDGSTFVVSDRTFPYFDENGDVIGFNEIIEDITERKKTEKDLQESEQRYRSIVETSPLGIALADIEPGILVDVNKALCNMVGRSSEELIGQPQSILHPESDHLDSGYSETFNKHKHDDAGKTLLAKIKRKDGGLRDIEISANPVHLSGREFLHGFFKDVTERRAIEAQLWHAQKMDAIGTLAGGIAHDFNNILAGILGYAELSVSKVPAGSTLQKYLDHILKASQRGKDLVAQILTFSSKRGEAPTPVKIQPIVRECVKLLRATVPITIDIEFIAPEEPLTVLATSTELHQVLMNLVTNGSQAMGGESGRIVIKLIETSINDEEALIIGVKLGEFVSLQVSDTGPGIPPEIKASVFDAVDGSHPPASRCAKVWLSSTTGK
ncbi:MAG: PAS domain S-box protein [Alphaproteobacteria bacterium]|nr:PAS domain S-box protein [Alphaproteobacteria bacterium]